MQSFNHQNTLATYTCEGDLADIRDTNRRKNPSCSQLCALVVETDMKMNHHNTGSRMQGENTQWEDPGRCE